MNPTIRKLCGGPHLRRIIPPANAWIIRLRRIRVMPMRKFGDHNAHVPKVPTRHST